MPEPASARPATTIPGTGLGEASYNNPGNRCLGEASYNNLGNRCLGEASYNNAGTRLSEASYTNPAALVRRARDCPPYLGAQNCPRP
jgi:hypothetical protein